MKVKNAFFILLFMYCSTLLFGQEVSSVKLKRIQLANAFLTEARALENSDPTKAIDLLGQALTNAIKEKNQQVEAESYFLLAKINGNSNQHDLAVDYYRKALTSFLLLKNEEWIYKTSKVLAITLEKTSDYDSALAVYDQFLVLAKKQGNEQDQLFVYQEKAKIYKKMGQYNAALKELDLAEEVDGSEMEMLSNLSEITLNRGAVLEKQENKQKALNVYQESEKLARETNNSTVLLNSNQRQSSLLKKSGKKRAAVKKRKEGLKYIKELQGLEPEGNAMEDDNLLELEESRVNIDIGQTYVELDSNEQAISYLRDAIEISNNLGEIQEEKEAYGYLSEAYLKSGQHDSALLAYQNYVALVDASYKLKEKDILATLSLKNELSKHLVRISSLEKDRELQEKTIALLESQRLIEVESNKRLKVIVYALIFCILLMIFLVYFMSKTAKEKKRSNQLLALKGLRTQMNPHFIFNALNSVNNFISQNDERSANKYLSDFSRLMRLVLENSEHDFIPLENEINILKLYVALEQARFSEKFDYQLTIDEELEIDKYAIPPMILQPYIENAVWHGLRYRESKGMLNIHIGEQHTDCLTVTIEDNGIGRMQSQKMKTKNQKTNRSTAMKNISERLSIINSIHNTEVEVLIDDLEANGSGTRVEVTVKAKA